MKNTKGITLIALIITIIVMLILVAVSISVALNTGLFKSAGDATKNWKSAQDTEANVGSEIKIGDKTYSSIEDYLESREELPEIKAGEKATETSKYQTAVIPKGFTVSNAAEEKDVEMGLVIYDIPDGSTVDWDNKTIKLPSESETKEIKTAVNQFVWIPVEVNKTTEPKDTKTSIASFKRNVWKDNARVVDNTQSTETFPRSTSSAWSNYIEPDTINDTATEITSQIKNLTESIYKYGGFYVGRYEAGSTEARNSSSGETTIGIKQDMYPYNYVQWGEGMSNIGTTGAVVLSNNLYNSTTKPDYGATSMLCTGACWDSMLDFIKDKDHNVTSSAKWGNYYDSETYKIYRGSLYSSSWSKADTTVGTNVTKNKNILLTTGASEDNSAKNIYDVAGNLSEWTTESRSSSNRVYRSRKFLQQCC